MEDTKSRFTGTVSDILREWDAGNSVWSVEMGGLGPGYEQAIQVTIIEFVRAGIDFKFSDTSGEDRVEVDEKDWKRFDTVCTATLKNIDDKLGGLSGAQYGAAKSVAWKFLKFGYADTMNTAPDDRLIQISNRWVAA